MLRLAVRVTPPNSPSSTFVVALDEAGVMERESADVPLPQFSTKRVVPRINSNINEINKVFFTAVGT